MRYRAFLSLVAMGILAGQTNAQMPSLPKGLGVGGIPNLGSISPGNAAGVLQYCMKNKLLSGGSANSVLGGLSKKPGVASSKAFSAGQAGQILTGQGKSFSLDQVQGPLKSQACDMVLKQAKTFI